MSMGLVTMVCYTLMVLSLSYLGIVMLIGLGVLMTEKAHQGDVSSWETISYLGSARNKTVYHYPLQKLST